MRYVRARYKQFEREWIYRMYVTDGLKVLGGLNVRYADLFLPENDDDRTADEIKLGICTKIEQLGGGPNESI